MTPYYRILLLTIILGSTSVFGQRANNRSRSELGIMAGGTYYIGDINPLKHFKNTHLAGSLLFKFELNPRVFWRANVMYGSVEASDADATRDIVVNRNLSFQTDIYEVGSGFEFNYFPFQIGHDRYKGTAYFLAELAVMHMNPKAEYNGELVELQPLGTEGQGTSLSNKKPYSLTQLAIPIGLGAKFSLGKKATIGLEYGLRFLFTDYLDDVGSYRYVDNATLADENGPLAAHMSNRSLDQSRFGRRGNPASRDWYSFAGLTLTFRLGEKDICFFKN